MRLSKKFGILFQFMAAPIIAMIAAAFGWFAQGVHLAVILGVIAFSMNMAWAWFVWFRSLGSECCNMTCCGQR